MARRLGTRVFLAGAIVPAAVLVWAAVQAASIADGGSLVQSVEWVPGLGLDIRLRLDGFALLFVFLISGIGLLVFVYSRWYVRPDPANGRLAATLLAFAGAMLGLVVSDNLLTLFVFWELTTVTSFLLIGSHDIDADARSAALQALLTTGVGGLAMLAGFVLLGLEAGTFTLSELLAEPPSGAVTSVALVLVLVGALTKSAQVPFHSWLPRAMAAPTPVSAYLHSATMVKAGVFVIARFAPVFGDVAVWRPIVVTAGLASMFVGGYRALRQHDLKLLLAFGTVSQLGLLVVLFGLGTPQASFAGCALLLAHAAFKAGLFLTVGVVDHQAKTRDLRLLNGMARKMPALSVAAGICAASMAGVPPLLGFVAKELVLEGVVAPDVPQRALIGVLVVAGAMLTVAYSARFQLGAFGRGRPGPDRPVDRPPPPFVAPVAILAAITVVCGLFPATLDWLVRAAAGSLGAVPADSYLALWHGVKLPLLLSAVSLAGGAVLIAVRVRLEAAQDAMPTVPSADRAYDGLVKGLSRRAADATGLMQNGSLPVYLAVILLTVVTVPAAALVLDPRWPQALALAHTPLQGFVGAVAVVAAIVACRQRRRFSAVVLLGVVGYAMAGLFVIHGAPDLALTQLVIETLLVVVFMLVLRRLPDEFPPRTRQSSLVAASVALVVAAFVFVFSLLSTASRSSPPVSDAYLERAQSEAGGRNVVNVVLVDFRGLDTLGEITVLAVAAVGVVMLVRGRRHEDVEQR
ncbi:hydrogen gas-evolving membrane-bound hydrogenase subunit E [Rhabdothermincola sp.]|uniref:hydrogen gas-evolving membrane-bound hydrogenase subunit E n=1 Tax=Rhabdothermincola sp. TaxID=2820405 RepID=UPI002FE162F2